MKFTVRDAGEVEIQREGDQLVLVDARANAGWDVEIDSEDEDDEVEEESEDVEDAESEEEDVGEALEVTFVQENHEVEFEAEIVDGRLLIEIEESWYGVEPGTFTVDEAGTVEIRRDGDRLILAGVIANDGWDFEAEREVDEGEESSEQEIEVTFTSGDRTVEFEATLEDGALEIEIETKWYVDEE